MQDDYLKYIGTIGESLRGFSKWTEIYEQQINAIQLATSLQPVLDATARYRNVIDSLVPRHIEMLQGLELPWNRDMLNGTLRYIDITNGGNVFRITVCSNRCNI